MGVIESNPWPERRRCCFLNRKFVLVFLRFLFLYIFLFHCSSAIESQMIRWRQNDGRSGSGRSGRMFGGASASAAVELKLYPLLFLNACLDFLFKICYFQFFIFFSPPPPLNSMGSFPPVIQFTPPRRQQQQLYYSSSSRQTARNRCCSRHRATIASPMTDDGRGAKTSYPPECMFIYRKNAIINCVD